MKEIKEIVKINKNNSKGTSIKVTIPAVIANKLNLNIKDSVVWTLQENDNNEYTLILSKLTL